MAKSKKLFSKIVMIAFLLMVVIGFTIPLFNLGGDSPDKTPTYLEPRLCQADPDCYLICDDQPMKVLCLQNLCQINSCREYNLYPYRAEPLKFDLSIEVEGEVLDLSLYSNLLDFFTSFEEDKVEVFTTGLSLGRVLEKAGVSLEGGCLTVGGKQSCPSEEKELKLRLNGEEFYDYNYYVPKEGDLVEIVYS